MLEKPCVMCCGMECSISNQQQNAGQNYHFRISARESSSAVGLYGGFSLRCVAAADRRRSRQKHITIILMHWVRKLRVCEVADSKMVCISGFLFKSLAVLANRLKKYQGRITLSAILTFLPEIGLRPHCILRIL